MIGKIMASLILVITSKTGFANAVEAALPGMDYQAVLASDAQQAISLLAGQIPGLILLGDTVQGMVQQASLLRKHFLTAKVPIILQSDNYSVHSLAYRQHLGAQAVVENPYATRDLIDTIRRFSPIH